MNESCHVRICIWMSRLWMSHGTSTSTQGLSHHLSSMSTQWHSRPFCEVMTMSSRTPSLLKWQVIPMGWLRSVRSIKLQVSFAEYRLFYMALLQKRPIILSILLTKATLYVIAYPFTSQMRWLYHCVPIHFDRKKPPPPGGGSRYYLPWSRAVCKYFTTRCNGRISSWNLLHTALDQGT